MAGTIVLIVIGLLLAGGSIPVIALIGTFVGALFDEDFAPLGFVAGWILGIVGVGFGLFLVIYNAISLVQQLTS